MIDNLNDALHKFFNYRFEMIHTCIPGKVEKYDGQKKRTARITPLVKMRNQHNDLIDLPTLEKVPIMFPSTAEFNMLYPIKKGDIVLLLFAEQGIGTFLNGQGTTQTDPETTARFELNNAIAIPGIWPTSTIPKVKDVNDSDFFLTFKDFKIQVNGDSGETEIKNKDGNTIILKSSGIEIDGSEVAINGNTLSFVTYAALDAALQSLITNIKLWQSTHTHAGVTTGPGSTAPPPTPPTYTLDISAAETSTVKTGG